MKSPRKNENTNSDGKYVCPHCDYQTIRESVLTKHLQIHTMEKPLKCPKCDYIGVTPTGLRHHMNRHTDSMPFHCSQCDYKCRSQSIMKVHLLKHSSEKPHRCTQCKFSTASATCLKRHVETHTQDKTFQCTLCDYKCLRLYQLQRHTKRHTGDKPYACMFCKFTSTASDNVRRHMMKHTGLKPYLCTLCGYNCAHAGNFTTHMRKHTGEKRFQCPLCDYKASVAFCVKRHLKNRHDGSDAKMITLPKTTPIIGRDVVQAGDGLPQADSAEVELMETEYQLILREEEEDKLFGDSEGVSKDVDILSENDMGNDVANVDRGSLNDVCKEESCDDCFVADAVNGTVATVIDCIKNNDVQTEVYDAKDEKAEESDVDEYESDVESKDETLKEILVDYTASDEDKIVTTDAPNYVLLPTEDANGDPCNIDDADRLLLAEAPTDIYKILTDAEFLMTNDDCEMKLGKTPRQMFSHNAMIANNIKSGLNKCDDDRNAGSVGFLKTKGRKLPACVKNNPEECDLIKSELTADGKFACRECDYTNSRVNTMVRHARRHTANKPYVCEDCGYATTALDTLKRHRMQHTGERPHQCTQCDFKTSRASNLRQHLATHSNIKSHLCESCSYASTSSEGLKQHMKTHTGIKPFVCNKCGYRCRVLNMLLRHLKVHAGVRPYQCDQCDYAAATPDTLKRHVVFKHTLEKNLFCSQCGYRTSNIGNLRKHEMRHNSEKPFMCAQCPYRCKDSGSLKRHEKKHTRSKAKRIFECQTCDKVFCRPSYLKRHMRFHATETEIDSVSKEATKGLNLSDYSEVFHSMSFSVYKLSSDAGTSTTPILQQSELKSPTLPSSQT